MADYSVAKTIEKGIRGLIAGAIAAGCTYLATKGNLEISAEEQLAIVSGIIAVISVLTNFLKHKFPKIFGWL